MLIVIIDLELGNLYNIASAFRFMGANVVVTDDHDIINSADKIVLAGVGSYKTGMDSILNKELLSVIKLFADKGKPILGICLGMQMLMDHSEENDGVRGLGLIPGRVKYFNSSNIFSSEFKVPNMGWNSVYCNNSNSSYYDKILQNVLSDDEFYFLHSLFVSVDNKRHSLLLSSYGGVEFSSMVKRKNILGCQFHPEKSGNAGLKIIKNFINIG